MRKSDLRRHKYVDTEQISKMFSCFQKHFYQKIQYFPNRNQSVLLPNPKHCSCCPARCTPAHHINVMSSLNIIQAAITIAIITINVISRRQGGDRNLLWLQCVRVFWRVLRRESLSETRHGRIHRYTL